MPIQKAATDRMLVAAGSSHALRQITDKEFDDLTDGRVSLQDWQYARDVVNTLKAEHALPEEQAVARRLLEAVSETLNDQSAQETLSESWKDLRRGVYDARDALFSLVSQISEGLKKK